LTAIENNLMKTPFYCKVLKWFKDQFAKIIESKTNSVKYVLPLSCVVKILTYCHYKIFHNKE